MAVSEAPQSLGTADIALQSLTALAIALACDGSVAAPQEPFCAKVTTVQSCSAGSANDGAVKSKHEETNANRPNE
jgi:hypothetical protein